MSRKANYFAIAATCVVLATAFAVFGLQAVRAQGAITKYELDPFWLKLPDKWVVGALGGACLDNQDHVFVLHRQESLSQERLTGRNLERGIMAPPVIEIDPNGNVINSWGDSKVLGLYLHDCAFDKDGNIWIVGARSGYAQKWSRDGKKLLLQIGKSGVFDSSDGPSKGNP